MSSVIGTIILLLTGLATYRGFIDRQYYERHVFHTDPILVDKQYDRLFSSGFLHANWIHFGFNMVALLSFSWSLEFVLGVPKYLLIYLGALLGGNILALYLHRNHGDYRAVGASGAISGVIFSSIILFPEVKISLILLPFEISTWVFGLCFVVISIFGIKSQSDNIGHDAHLGGAIVGVLLTIIMQPSVLQTSWWLILLLLVPTTVFLILIVRNPAVLLVDNYWGEGLQRPTRKKPSGRKKEPSLDYLLDKIKHQGIDSLTPRERELLDHYREKM
jgi:membrane associated rhomboid family serine protease